jgi:peptide/nickel transport system substrate-binding protein
MKIRTGWFIPAAVAATLLATGSAWAQKPSGVLKIQHMDTPPSASIHEEATVSTAVPFMSLYNNLVMFDQNVAKNSFETIVPDLATKWVTSADGKQVAFTLRQGVKWHDGKPFTAKDVACTFELLLVEGKLRRNPRGALFGNVEKVTADSDFAATFHLKERQPSLLALLATGYTPIYPCHVPSADMRRKPIGTGPFKLVEFKMNEGIKLAKNPDYWKPGRPYLDGIEYTVVPNRSTRVLAFVSKEFDVSFPHDLSPPLVKSTKEQRPDALCEIMPGTTSNLVLNREAPPFDNAEMRRAFALTIDRKAFVDIIGEGEGTIGGALLPPPNGVWGLPPEIWQTIPGYGGDIRKNRDEARAIMQKLGYGPNKRLAMKVSARNVPIYRDPAVIMIDQLREIYVDAELEIVETANWFAKLARKDYTIGMNTTGNGVDDPDAVFYEGYACGAERNYSNYCNKDLEKLFDEQSMEPDQEKRKKLVWEIDRRLQVDLARPFVFHMHNGTCQDPHVKNFVVQTNSLYNGWRHENVWLDR